MSEETPDNSPAGLRDALERLEKGKADNGTKQWAKILTPLFGVVGLAVVTYGQDREEFKQGAQQAEANAEAIREMRSDIRVIRYQIEDSMMIDEEELAEEISNHLEDD